MYSNSINTQSISAHLVDTAFCAGSPNALSALKSEQFGITPQQPQNRGGRGSDNARTA